MKLIDLSTPIDANFSVPQYPFAYEHLDMGPIASVTRDGYQSTKFTLTTHTGTHMDVPVHRFRREEKPTGFYYLEDVPLEHLYGEAVVLDIPKGEYEPITGADFENAALEIKPGDIVLVHTGWGRFFAGKERRNWHYLFERKPGLDVDGAEWLVRRKIKMYGQDTCGTQHPRHSFRLDPKARDAGVVFVETEPVHDLMLINDILLIEHLWNLDKIANRRVTVGFFPLPFQGTDGSPIRAVAFVDE